jgi:hypothetical protein
MAAAEPVIAPGMTPDRMRTLEQLSANIRRLIGQTSFANTASFHPQTQKFIEFLYYFDGLSKYLVNIANARGLSTFLPDATPDVAEFLRAYEEPFMILRATWLDILFVLRTPVISEAIQICLSQTDSFVQVMTQAAALRLNADAAANVRTLARRIVYAQLAVARCWILASATRVGAIDTDFPDVQFQLRNGAHDTLARDVMQTVRRDSEDLYQGYLTFIRMLKDLFVRQAGGRRRHKTSKRLRTKATKATKAKKSVSRRYRR